MKLTVLFEKDGELDKESAPQAYAELIQLAKRRSTNITFWMRQR